SDTHAHAVSAGAPRQRGRVAPPGRGFHVGCRVSSLAATVRSPFARAPARIVRPPRVVLKPAKVRLRAPVARRKSVKGAQSPTHIASPSHTRLAALKLFSSTAPGIYAHSTVGTVDNTRSR